jgi:hypothetical protein
LPLPMMAVLLSVLFVAWLRRHDERIGMAPA